MLYAIDPEQVMGKTFLWIETQLLSGVSRALKRGVPQ